MFLDHFNAFADFQPVDFASNLPAALAGSKPRNRQRPRQNGFVPHTLVETENGFVQARELKAGDLVFTLDGGNQEILSVKHSVPRLTAMMHVPAGALGNDRALDLPADQIVALESHVAEQLFDVPVVTAKLVSLAGYNGITSALPQRIARIHITFAEEELVWTECGMLLRAGDDPQDTGFWMLSLIEARTLVTQTEGRALPEQSAIVETAAASAQVQLNFFGELETTLEIAA